MSMDASSSSRPIKASIPRRSLALATIKLHHLGLWNKRRWKSTFFPFKNVCIKTGYGNTLHEASTLQFVAARTSIPVPRVYCAFVHQNKTYIVTERIRGQSIDKELELLSEAAKFKLYEQLRAMIQELRAIPFPEGGRLSNIDGGPLLDYNEWSRDLGPFDTVQDFHRGLRDGVTADADTREGEFKRLCDKHEGPWPAPVFTHGELLWDNILVKDRKVVGIVDWDTAGWYPSYWEYTKTHTMTPLPGRQWWRAEADKFLDPMPEELEMEYSRCRQFGPFCSYTLSQAHLCGCG